ncbi:MAG: apolipoprotein N-acyltransferase [Bacteroidota bacterium]
MGNANHNKFLSPAAAGALHALCIHLPYGGLLSSVVWAILVYLLLQDLLLKDVLKISLVYGFCYGFLVQIWVFDSSLLVEESITSEAVIYFFVLSLVNFIYGLISVFAVYLVIHKLSAKIWVKILSIASVLLIVEFIQRLIWLDMLPWVTVPIGYALASLTPLIQLAEYGGVWLISFLVYIFNAWLAYTYSTRDRGIFLGLVTFFILWVGSGTILMHQNTIHDLSDTVRVALLKDNVNHQPWSDKNGDQRAGHIIAQATEIGKLTGVDLVLWSETAVPWIFQTEDDLIKYALQSTIRLDAHHLIGTKIEEKTTSSLYNAALLLSPDGGIVDMHRKTRPLPLLESERLGLLADDREGQSLNSSSKISTLNLNNTRLGVGICNEWMHAEFANTLKEKGAELFVNLSNNNYFRLPVMRIQHLNSSIFRCVENRLEMVINNNLGFSGRIDRAGHYYIYDAETDSPSAINMYPVSDED